MSGISKTKQFNGVTYSDDSSDGNILSKTHILGKAKARINLKTLSVNEAWKGRRSKTDKYENYCLVLFYDLLPKNIELPEPPFQIEFTFGFSSKSSDWDNPIKPLQDVLAKKYKFNDKLIKRGIVSVVDVKKGDEFFQFEIRTKEPLLRWVKYSERKPTVSEEYHVRYEQGLFIEKKVGYFDLEGDNAFWLPTDIKNHPKLEWLEEIQ
jgi:hypothetical protein